jgi:signal peptidase I
MNRRLFLNNPCRMLVCINNKENMRMDVVQPSGALYWLRVAAIGRKPAWTLVRMLVLVLVTIVTFKFVLIPIRVTGISMEPTYHDRSINFINRLSYLHSEPCHGDVVGIRFAGDRLMLLKRIVGLPGETISYSDGHVCINGVRQEEPYLKLSIDWEMEGKKLGPDEYYVVGDNRSMPQEYHKEGIAKRWRIIGKTVFPGNK